MTHQTTSATGTLAASAVQPDPAAHTAWINRIRELRLAGHTLDQARAIAGPMPDSAGLNALADQITIGVLIEAFAGHGITLRAFCAAYHAVLHSDAFEGSADAQPVRDH